MHPTQVSKSMLIQNLRAATIVLGTLALLGCQGAPPKPRAVAPIVRDYPTVLRGTVGSESTIRGIDPVLITGYGIVVGLNGTGGGPLPAPIQGSLERDLSLKGVSRNNDFFNGTPFAGLTPQQFLRRDDVAVVMVVAEVPSGAPEGFKFDVWVRTLPGSSVSSLEGGTLWSTDLHIGPPQLFGAADRPRTRQIASASGPIFINPFAEPGQAEEDSDVIMTEGRVLDGGAATNPLLMELVMDNPSPSRARQTVWAINTRFPRGPRDGGPAARGRGRAGGGTQNLQSIAIQIPFSYRDEPAEFLNLLRYLNTDYLYPESHARRYTEALKTQPWLAEELSWSLRALGEPALPFLRKLYDFGESAPARLAALRAGASLGDARAAPALKDLALNGPGQDQLEAIRLLGTLSAGPTVDVTLRELLASPQLAARIEAYEALAQRAEARKLGQLINQEQLRAGPGYIPASQTHLERLARASFHGGATLQGVERRMISDKFLLDIVPFGEPLIYITQHGEPRIVLFGENLKLERPMFVSTWSNRLMIAADSESDDIRLYYQDWRTDQVTQKVISDDLVEFIHFAAHSPTPDDPRPGLSMTYSEVVGALHALYEAQGVANAGFATEQDRLMASLLAAAEGAASKERPELSDGKRDLLIFDRPKPKTDEPQDGPSLVEPISPKADGTKSQSSVER